MSKIKWNGGALLAPVPPALVTCGTMERSNVLTIAWTGILNTIPPKTYIAVRPERFSYPLIERLGAFVINLPTAKLVRAVDLCGVKSGRDTDKFALTGLTPVPAGEVPCPLIAESPLALECRVTQKIPLGSHDMFLADIVAVDVEQSLIDRAGKLHLDRAGLLAYAHGEYFELGKKLGSFGYSVRKKTRPPQKSRADGAGSARKPRKKR
ncbi:flavin reductase family protein [Agathobaculum sp. NTUH-O15-33]|uniref:flavin reductase family protein n=1 Tax=Agathobaculum sp. NTUH-O15-33 TaxID=3079302 RepID=UPI002958CF26|nr:flavin reductase family protein [Agathobaculum sp. NTUH-O15-33]WNX85955.1 flavin reductase family protein [Agathobaculum sp. NTUH-O15-33]